MHFPVKVKKVTYIVIKKLKKKTVDSDKTIL